MPAQYGFGSLFGGPPADQHMRVGDVERRAAADRLGEHFADGRLDQAEFDERNSRAMSAKTRADLTDLFTDLPETGAPAGPVRPPRGRVRSALVLVAVVAVIMIAAHALLAIAPLLWLGFFAVVLLFATRTAGHHRSEEDRQSRVSGGGGITEPASAVLGGGGMTEHEASAVLGGGGMTEHEASAVRGDGGMTEHEASAVRGDGGMSEHEASAVAGLGGMTEQEASAVAGGGGMTDLPSAVLGGGGMTEHEVTAPASGSISLMLRLARPFRNRLAG